MARDKVILAYSGGLDTSVMVPWIGEKYNLDVVTFTVDLGQGRRYRADIRQKAMKTEAVDAIAVSMPVTWFVDHFVFPALMADASLLKGRQYPLATGPRPAADRLAAWWMLPLNIMLRRWLTAAQARATTRCGFDVTFVNAMQPISG